MAPLSWCLSYSLQRRQSSPIPLPLWVGGRWAALVRRPFRRPPVAFTKDAGLKSSDWVPHILRVGFAFLRLWALAGSWTESLVWSVLVGTVPSSFSRITLLHSITPILLPTCGLSLLSLWPCPSWLWGCCPCLPWKSFMIWITVLYSSFPAGIDVDRLFFRDQPLSSERVCSAFSALHSACRPCASVYPRK